MKKVSTFIVLSILFLVSNFTTIYSQTFDGEWQCLYATTDDDANGTGIQTISVGVLAEDEFVGMVSQSALPWEIGDACYLVGYRNADSTQGRLGTTPYGSSSDYRQIWLNGFDQVYMDHALDLATHNGLIFVPNNDADHNILVFELGEDSVYTHPKRMVTLSNAFNPDTLWAIDTDGAGRVYVTTKGSITKPSKVLIYESPDVEGAWSSGHTADPLQIITLPDNGASRGVTVSNDGSIIYASNYDNGKIYAFVGNATDGYSLSPSFSFERQDSAGSNLAAPWGLQFMDGKNILFAAMADDFHQEYSYGRMYAINPNTGEILDTIDVAQWNYDVTGAYNSRPDQIGIASGYTSTFNVAVDDADNLYSQSYYGWTVEKWNFDGTLPTIELTITGVEKLDSQIPNSFEVSQNYPNPFNPSTTIEFSINERAPITLSIYNINGELITKLVDGAEFEAGLYKVTFDASRLATGTYIYNISNGKSLITKKMTLLK